MRTINNYIFEKLVIDTKVPKAATIEGKLKEIFDQCVKDGDFNTYSINKINEKEIQINLPKEVRIYFPQIKEIIEVNFDGKYDIKEIDWNLAKSYMTIHL